MNRGLRLGIAAAAVGLGVGLGVGVGLPFLKTDTESGRDACMRGLSENVVTAAVEGWSWSPDWNSVRVNRAGRVSRRVGGASVAGLALTILRMLRG